MEFLRAYKSSDECDVYGLDQFDDLTKNNVNNYIRITHVIQNIETDIRIYVNGEFIRDNEALNEALKANDQGNLERVNKILDNCPRYVVSQFNKQKNQKFD